MLTFQLFKSQLNLIHPENMDFIFVTLLTFHPDTSNTKSLNILYVNKPDISVILLVSIQLKLVSPLSNNIRITLISSSVVSGK